MMSGENDSSKFEVNWQETPNPYALKFITNRPLKMEGKATFVSQEECKGLPMISSLLDIFGVKQVYVQGNALTISHDGQMSAENIVNSVESVLMTRITIHDADFVTDGEESKVKSKATEDRSHLSKEQQEIEEILDRTVRPGLNADGGDVEVISYENDELRILYEGACGGCPSAMMGTLDAIQNIIRHELDNPNIIVIPI